MKWIEATVKFEAPDPETATDLIAGIFIDTGLSGVVIQSPEDEPETDWDKTAPPLPDDWVVKGYFPENKSIARRKQKLELGLEGLGRLGISGLVTYTCIDDCDWAESWKTHFHPVRISDALVVKPTWREFEAGPSDIIIEIDPGMAFGTGTHATTRLCLQLLERHIRKGDQVLDIGTGSGILMVAAAKLGAIHVSGIDTDEVAVEIARQNLLKNHIAPSLFDTCIATIDAISGHHFDLICANIITEVVIHIISRIRPLLSASGRFICSGIPDERKDDALSALTASGLAVIDIRQSEGWTAIAASVASNGN